MTLKLIFLVLLWTTWHSNAVKFNVNFEDQTLGSLSTECAKKNYTVSYGIVKISELDVPQPDSGNYGLVTSNGFGCFETEFIDIDQGSFLEMQYLSTGNDDSRLRMDIILENNYGSFKTYNIKPTYGTWKTFKITLPGTKSNKTYLKVRYIGIFLILVVTTKHQTGQNLSDYSFILC
jgi:hypothetical protein